MLEASPRLLKVNQQGIVPLSTLVADVLGVILLAALCALCLSARAPTVSEIQLSAF